jgi:hypothetical protein
MPPPAPETAALLRVCVRAEGAGGRGRPALASAHTRAVWQVVCAGGCCVVGAPEGWACRVTLADPRLCERPAAGGKDRAGVCMSAALCCLPMRRRVCHGVVPHGKPAPLAWDSACQGMEEAARALCVCACTCPVEPWCISFFKGRRGGGAARATLASSSRACADGPGPVRGGPCSSISPCGRPSLALSTKAPTPLPHYRKSQLSHKR